MTPKVKVHAIFYHVNKFCTKNQQSLGFYSEHAMEAVYFEFRIVWHKYELKTSHPEYHTQLLKAVNEFNGLHI